MALNIDVQRMVSPIRERLTILALSQLKYPIDHMGVPVRYCILAFGFRTPLLHRLIEGNNVP